MRYTRTTRYKVLADGVDWPDGDGKYKRAEKGDVIEGVPPKSAMWLVEDNALEVTGEDVVEEGGESNSLRSR